MSDNEKLVPEMRASLDSMTTKMSGESKEDLVKDYEYAVSSEKCSYKLTNTEKRAVDTYEKHLR